ncbi:MAG: cupin domain-containing protein [Xanthobacteraceae bacterium]|jgi:gentisate 1,2-dioxygenase
MADAAILTKPGKAIASLDALYAEADRLDVTPGWVKRERPILWPQPHSQFVPAHWSYRGIHDALEAAGSLVDVTLAERRNLVLRNPCPGNNFATTATFACAYQMILPGEKAPTHRHSPHALRVIIDAKGAYSVVDGEKTPMDTGDVVLTPGWCWHGHGHDGDEPAYWFDGLDVPTVHSLESMFFEEHPDKYEKVARVAATSPYRFSRADMARRLDAAAPDRDGLHGPRITLDAPQMPTMMLTMERLAAGQKTRRQRSTANHVFVVVEGTGATIVDGNPMAWRAGDTLAVPTWMRFEHAAASDAVLFAMSDEPLMRFAKYYRVELD